MKKDIFTLICEDVMNEVLNEFGIDERSKASKSKEEENDEEEKLSDKAVSGKKANAVKDALSKQGTDDFASYNFTRSQLAYELWPNIDPDAARSKLSKKINGKRNWKNWEINRLYNIISGKIG